MLYYLLFYIITAQSGKLLKSSFFFFLLHLNVCNEHKLTFENVHTLFVLRKMTNYSQKQGVTLPIVSLYQMLKNIWTWHLCLSFITLFKSDFHIVSIKWFWLHLLIESHCLSCSKCMVLFLICTLCIFLIWSTNNYRGETILVKGGMLYIVVGVHLYIIMIVVWNKL